jgi:hypothetical protein
MIDQINYFQFAFETLNILLLIGTPVGLFLLIKYFLRYYAWQKTKAENELKKMEIDDLK